MVYATVYDNLSDGNNSWTKPIGFSEDRKKANDIGRAFALEEGIPLPDGDCDISSIPTAAFDMDGKYVKDGDVVPEYMIANYMDFSIEEFELDKCCFDRIL
jgi:hypothetical protein